MTKAPKIIETKLDGTKSILDKETQRGEQTKGQDDNSHDLTVNSTPGS